MRSARALIVSTLGLALLCFVAGEARAERLGVVVNNGRGGGYRGGGGTYKAIPINTFGPNDRVGYRVLSGSFSYWVIHARYDGGVWKTAYKGRDNNIPMARIRKLIAKLRRGRPTHLNFSVNGAHERYDRRACKIAIVRNARHAPPSIPGQLGVVVNNGRGGGYRGGGGTYKAIPINTFGPGDRIGYRVLSGSFKYWVIHARYNGGVWKTLYKGRENFIPMARIQRRIAQMRRGRPTHLNFSVNGAHESYEPRACRLALIRRVGSAPPAPPPHAHGGSRIQIVSGTYGQNCGARRGNKTAHLRRSCQGRTSCVYTIDYRVIGDPRRGCGKNYVAEWRCSGQTNIRRAVASPEAGYRKKITLTCGANIGRPHPPHHPMRPSAAPRAQRVFRAVPKQSSKNFKHNRHRRLRIATSHFDRVPYHVAPSAVRTVTLRRGQRCFFAGNAAGTAGFGVDNFLLVTIGKRGQKRRFLVGHVDPVTFKGRRLTHLAGKKFNFRAGEVDLTPYIPKGVPTRVKVEALDYGAVGWVSNLFLIVR